MPYQKRQLLDRCKGLYLKHTATKGRGVFCTRALKTGEVLETTPTIILTENENDLIDRTILRDYAFVLGAISRRIRNQLGIRRIRAASCVIMGMASFCNHDENPNAEIVWEEYDGTIYHILRVTRPIPRHTEICTTYGEGWFDERE